MHFVRMVSASTQLMLCQKLISDNVHIVLPTRPPPFIQAQVWIPNVIGEDWKSSRDVLDTLLSNQALCDSLQQQVQEMEETKYSPVYLSHPLLLCTIVLYRGDGDGEFVYKLQKFLEFI